MIANRRKYFRIKTAETPCKFLLGNLEFSAALTDESSAGIQVSELSLMTLSLDQKITVTFRGETVTGRCRSITRSENGLFRVGIYREQVDYQHKHVSYLLNTFMRNDSISIVCAVNEVSQEGLVQVRMVNGKSFVLDRQRIVEMTREERLADLLQIESESRFSEVVAIYASMVSQFDFSNVDSVLDQEFGPPARRLAG